MALYTGIAPRMQDEAVAPAIQNSDGGDVVDDVRATLEDYLAFYDSFTRDTEHGWPSWSQSIRVRALMKNKRVLVADDTGVNGKTFTAISSKVALERENHSRFPAFIVSPNSGMVNAWSESSINEYAANLHAGPQKVLTVRNYGDLAYASPDLDFLVINWEKLSVSPQSPEWQGIERAIQAMKPEFFGIDELHNGKTASSLRGQSLQRLTAHTIDKHLMMLSATPIPNRYRDLSIVFHMLDPVKYPSPLMFTYSPAEVMRELLGRQVWFRLTRQDLKEELGLGNLTDQAVPFELTRQEAEAYFKCWSACVTVGEGLSELRKILYNSRLSKYAGSDVPAVSSKMRAAKALADRKIRDGYKVAIKTNYVTGLIDELSDLLRADHKVITVKSQHSLEERKELYGIFRHSSDNNILVVGPHSTESIDLTTGAVPLALISVEPEMTPGEFNQWTGRGYRRGQTADVEHFSLVAQSALLNEWMSGYVVELCQNFGLRPPKKFVPRTIDLDMIAMRKAKQAVVEKVYGAREITREEESIYDAQDFNTAMRHLASFVAPGSFKSAGPFQIATLMQTRWRNLGEDEFARLKETMGWAGWRRRYEEGWKGSASEETLRIIGPIVDRDRSGRQHYTVAVVVAGAAYFSRATGIEAICLDIDDKFLEMGRKVCEQLGIKNTYVPARATSLPLPDSSVDAVVNAYTIFYLGQDDKRQEVEQCILETNRVLKDSGLFVVALPYTIEATVIQRFSANAQQLGFTPSLYLSPLETSRDTMSHGCHILGFRKTASVQHQPGLAGLDMSFYGVNGQRVKFLG